MDVTPADANVRTRVHEYGGGAYLLDADGAVIYSNFVDQRLYRAVPGAEEPLCLTPESAACPEKRFRFADGSIEPGGERLICVREDHGPEGNAKPADVVNEVVALKLDGSGDMQVLATGRDFYAHPRVSPDGARLCYVAWNHPAMPWDATELRVASLADAAAAPATEAHELVDGAAYSGGKGMSDSDVSVLALALTLTRCCSRRGTRARARSTTSATPRASTTCAACRRAARGRARRCSRARRTSAAARPAGSWGSRASASCPTGASRR